MKTKGIRIYGKEDLRLEEFVLPAIKEDQILVHIVSNSICMSSHKAALQGEEHKRVPNDIAQNPTLIGHEFCGEIVEVGKKWQHKFQPGRKFSIQPALGIEGKPEAPGYSFPTIGGNATYNVLTNEIMQQGCLLEYNGPGYFFASLSEPMSCIIGAFHANYHTVSQPYHQMGIKENGNMILLAGAGPMGLGAVDYAIHCDRRPGILIVTDIDDERLARAESIYSVEEAKKSGVDLRYINTGNMSNPVESLLSYTNGKGYDDVFVFAPVKPVVETADQILGRDGCLNFFAGPQNQNFSSEINFYNVHYNSTHIIGTSGGSTDDMKESLDMMAKGLINPSTMVTHIGGLTSAVETILNLPNIPGGKKLIYTNLNMELTAIKDFKLKGEKNPLFAELAKITERHNGIWSVEAEEYLLSNANKL